MHYPAKEESHAVWFTTKEYCCKPTYTWQRKRECLSVWLTTKEIFFFKCVFVERKNNWWYYMQPRKVAYIFTYVNCTITGESHTTRFAAKGIMISSLFQFYYQTKIFKQSDFYPATKGRCSRELIFLLSSRLENSLLEEFTTERNCSSFQR